MDDKFITNDYLQQCQANYIRDVQGGTVAPSSSSELTGIAVQ
ncbi:colicin release lysis protein [Klebsiella pneumoniae]|nr:colicin release lysis protein [Klebsiella pneumoniae]AYW28023.1 lysis protein for colicin E6 [Klebsiella pneumoniae]